MKAKEWFVNMDQEEYKVTYKQGLKGKNCVELNGETVEMGKLPMQFIRNFDIPIFMGEKECRLVALGNKTDLAVDGVYLNSKKEYVPLKSMPKWTWIFIALCLLIPIICMGGAFPALFGGLGAICCARVGIAPSKNIVVKILGCIGITVAAWIGILVFIGIVSGFIY